MTDEIAAATSLPLEKAPRRAGISRIMVNFCLDATLLAAFIGLCWVSAVIQFVFPAGAAPVAYQIWGATGQDWQGTQFVLLCLLAGGIVLHIMLHWSWIMGVVITRLLGRKSVRDNGSHTLIGVGLFLAVLHLLALGCLAARMSLTAVTRQ